MHFHVPKPLHGWRELAGEVGIIVLGVLIALGFEQVVEAMRWRSEVGHFRKAVDHELGRPETRQHDDPGEDPRGKRVPERERATFPDVRGSHGRSL